MDLVIPYRHDPHGGTELVYALRSIEKYLTGYGNVWLIGDKPKWANLNHLPCPNHDGRKEFSIMQKVLTAVNCDQISDPFIMWHDDHFLLKELNVNDIKYWHNGSIAETMTKARGGYYLAMRHTAELGHENNFDVHTPIIFDKARFKALVASKKWDKEYLVKTLYCTGMEGEEITDCKLNFNYTLPQLKEKIENRLFFSTGPYCMTDDLMTLFNELYPDKSKFEK